MEETRITKARRFSKIWWKSRADAGKSQEYMALGIGVSRKTIQNWERGISFPDLFQGAAWFQLLGLNPVPYYMAFLEPWLFDDATALADDKKQEEALLQLVGESSPLEKRQLLFLIMGNHGCSWHALLQMLCAYCCMSSPVRIAVAQMIKETCQTQEDMGIVSCPDNVRPNLEVLENAIREEKEALLKRKA